MPASTLISLVISICALALTVYSLYATRRHNRLSVVPHLHGYENESTDDKGLTYSYDISNNGIGPARIKKFILLRHDKAFPKGEGNYVRSSISEHLGNQVNYEIKFSFNFGYDASLRAGETRRIVEMFFPGVKTGEEDKFWRLLKGMALRIEYESFYGQKFVFDTRNEEAPGFIQSARANIVHPN